MIQKEKLTFIEVVIALLISFLAVVMGVLVSYITAGIDQRLHSDIAYEVFWFVCFLYVNYLIFFKFNDRDSKTKIDHKSRISQIKKVLGSIQVKKIIISKNMLFFVLTIVVGIIATFVMTIGAFEPIEFFGSMLRGFYRSSSEWDGLGFVIVAFVMSGISSCVFAKWISFRTRNVGVKWAAILPIIFMDLYVLLVLIGTPIEMLIRVLEGKPPLHF